MTLIEAYRNGERVGRCDERCYDAQTGPCHCICGGVNHQVGIEAALKNTRTRAREWNKPKRRGKGRIRYVVPPEVQPRLWE